MKKDELIKIRPGLIHRIHKLSKETNKDASYHLNRALEDYIDEQEDLKEALERLKDKKDKVISSEQMRKSLGF